MKTAKKVILIVLAAIGILAFASVAEGFIPEAFPSKPQAQIVIPEPPLTTPQEVEAAINKFRSDRGLHVLTDSVALDNAAQERAETMCAANDWSHTKAWEVLDQHYEYLLASENLHYAHLQEGQAANAVYGWEHSEGHLKTMIANHVEFGVGVKLCPGYQGMEKAVLITSYYGVPR